MIWTSPVAPPKRAWGGFGRRRFLGGVGGEPAPDCREELDAVGPFAQGRVHLSPQLRAHGEVGGEGGGKDGDGDGDGRGDREAAADGHERGRRRT